MRLTLLMTMTMLALMPSTAPAVSPPPADDGTTLGCPAPSGWRSGNPTSDSPIRPIVNWLGVAPGGRLSWNGAPIEADEAIRYFGIVGMMRPRPHLVLVRLRDASCAELTDAAAFAASHHNCTADCWLANEPPPPPAPPAPPRQ